MKFHICQHTTALFFPFFAMLILMIVMPVSAYDTIVPVIDRGATIYIGEEGLNLTHALNRAGGLDGAAVDSEVPTNWTIGWWVSDIAHTASSKSLNISTTYNNFTVAPADFVGYWGYWYLEDPTHPRQAITGPDGKPRMVFKVTSPRLDMRIVDFDLDMDVTGKSTPRGDSLGFRIDTNMNHALNSHYRSPVYNSSEDGYINIKVKNETAYTYTRLFDGLNTPRDLLRLNISSSEWTWGDPGNPASPHPWATGAEEAGGEPVYPVGTYTVTAESLLNNMKENYRQGGADYTGKTVSEAYTITLVPDQLSLEANRDSVARGGHFSVTINGKPKSTYYLWVNDTGTMTGAPGDQPPTILASAPVYQDQNWGPFVIGDHTILSGSGKNLTEDVPPATEKVSQNEYYAKVITSSGSTATVEFRTSPDTKPGIYTIRAENQAISDEILVHVTSEILPAAPESDDADTVIHHPLINPDVVVPANNDLKRISRGGTVYIGEGGLDISAALAEADTLAVPAPSTEGSVIGFWSSFFYDISSSPSQKTIDLTGHETNFSVSPAEFVGYTGNWYLVNPSTGMVAQDSSGSPIMVVFVSDPSLNIRIWDLDTMKDVTDKSVPQGERLTFRVDTNMYSAFDSLYRPDISGSTPGTISIILRNENGARYNYLYQNNTTVISLSDLRIEDQPWFLGRIAGIPAAGGYWGTGLLDRDHYYFYPAGTYTVCAESRLNRMKENYRQAGADYTGKTVSQCYTITLVPEKMFNVTTISVDPPGDLVSGIPVNVSYVVNFSGTSEETFPSQNMLVMSTDLDNARWNYTLILDGVATPQPGWSGPSLSLSGWVLSFPSSVRESLNVTLEGRAPPVSSPISVMLVNVTEIDSHDDAFGRPFSKRALVNPSPLSGNDIGVFRSGQWIFDYKVDGTVDRRLNYGSATDIPITGDFNNDGTTDIGVFRSGQWILDYGMDRMVDRRFQYGLVTDTSLVGDFNNDGTTDIGVFRSGQWILDYGMDRTVDRRFQYGLPTDLPVVGDFNNDGTTDIGVFRSGQWILDYGMDRMVDRRFQYGLPTDLPVVGDFNN